jgi:glucose/arabinose dehydrogenase
LLPAHSSANALTFYTGDTFPNAKGDAFVALRGGWNATSKVGYCISRLLFENGHPYGELKMVNSSRAAPRSSAGPSTSRRHRTARCSSATTSATRFTG